MCRAACHGGAGDCGTNLAMVSIIMSQFSRQYEERQKEVRREQQTDTPGAHVLASFPLIGSPVRVLSARVGCACGWGGRTHR